MIETRKAQFSPIADPEGKPNCKRVYRIYPDGSAVERVHLSVLDPYERERLICIHYLKHYVRHFQKEPTGIRFLSRDNPWDFRVQLSTEREFNIEITAIADSHGQFEINKHEERLTFWISAETIPFHELQKLSRLLTGDRARTLVEEYEMNGIAMDGQVPNPFKGENARVFVSALYQPMEALDEKIRDAIEKKVKKMHSGKQETVLIIDNRTGAYDAPDYFSALESLTPFLDSVPFPEIWFYTGYYSDESGNHAEFSFAPLKTTKEQRMILDEMTQNGPVDENRRLVW